MKKSVRNIMGGLFLVTSLLAAALPTSEVEAVKSSASDFQIKGETLLKYTGTDTTVSIPDSVRVIGPEAFSGCQDLYRVDLPADLIKIGNGAFSGCQVLRSMKLPDSVREIGPAAFNGCTSLKQVSFGTGMDRLGAGAFSGCESLQEIDTGANANFVCDQGVLYNRDQKKVYQMLAGRTYNKYTMPFTVETIEPYAFWGCEGLKLLELDSGLREIPDYAFANCSSLEELSIPETVKSIGIKAFADCRSLKNTEIPASVTYIDRTAFDGCYQINILAAEGTPAAEYAAQLDFSDINRMEYEDASPSIRAAVVEDETIRALSPLDGSEETQDGEVGEQTLEPVPEEIGFLDNSGFAGDTYVVGGNAVVLMDSSVLPVFGGAASVSGNTAGSSTVSGDGTASGEDQEDGLSGAEQASKIIEKKSEKGGPLPKYTLVDDTAIAGQAYYGDRGLEAYEIPQGVTRIGDFAFARSGISVIDIPAGVTSIGTGAFYHCDNLEKVNIPSTVTEIGPAAFSHTKWLESWENGNSTDDFYLVGDGILLAYKGKGNRVLVPEGVKRIAPGVFQNHQGITEVNLPDSLEVIGEEAFAGCGNLVSVTNGMHVKQIKDRAFAGCPLNTVRIPDSLEEIGLRAFDYTGTKREPSSTAVVFQGEKLPVVTNEKTASRMANADYRDLALKGVMVAVVNDSLEEFEGTVLDSEEYGFRGLICSIEEESQDSRAGILRIKKCTLTEGTSIPESVSVYGKTYAFSNAGNVSYEGVPEEGSGKVVIKNGSDALQNGSALSAALPDGESGDYVLKLMDSPQAQEMLKKAYHTLYGEDSEVPMVVFDMSLWDAKEKIAIKRLGKEGMEISIPLPENLVGNTLHVVCTDEDGQLENVPFEILEGGKGNVVVLRANHFSPYGIYAYGGDDTLFAETLVKDGKAQFTSLTRKKDVSPDTGDGIHPKWFLAAGLLALAMICFFNRPYPLEVTGSGRPDGIR